ncbi:MAG TPA: hypothetical protein VH054_06650 [Polyangiaceae bacterium]|nr:hypothetical protein [Polyangiaceae bacterium]
MRSFVRLAILCASAGACAVATGSDDGGTSEAGNDDASTFDVKADVVDASANDAGKIDAAPDAPASLFASLQVNEVAPNVTNNEDIIELVATTGGSVLGISIEQDITTKVVFATLPDVTVAKGDIVVIHLNPPNGVATELTHQTDCASPSCYPNAWDIAGGTTAITYSGRLLLARGPDAGIQDGVAFYRSGTSSPATFFDQVEALQDAGQWLPADCSGNACSTNALAQAISFNWAGLPATLVTTAARSGNADTNAAGDWKVGASSLGAPNP